jgi:hypothetical protein
LAVKLLRSVLKHATAVILGGKWCRRGHRNEPVSVTRHSPLL